MVKVEDIQQYGKRASRDGRCFGNHRFRTAFRHIASAYGDYTKKSFEDTKSFVEKLSGVKSLDKAIEVQTEFAKSAYETFVAESQKIAGLYTDLAKQTFKPFEGLVREVRPGHQPTNCGARKTKGPAVVAGLLLVRVGEAIAVRRRL